MGFLHDEYEGEPMTTETPAADIVGDCKHGMRKSWGCPDCDIENESNRRKDEITRLRAENAELQRKLDESVESIFRAYQEGFSDGPGAHNGDCLECWDISDAKKQATSIRGEA